MINPVSYRFCLIALTHLGGCTANGAINPGSYLFCLVALTHLGACTANGEKIIRPGSYHF